MKLDNALTYNETVGILNNIYREAIESLYYRGLEIRDNQFRWELGRNIQKTMENAMVLTLPPSFNEEKPYLFGIQIKWLDDNPDEARLLYDMTERGEYDRKGRTDSGV